jgi:hypothetical protein
MQRSAIFVSDWYPENRRIQRGDTVEVRHQEGKLTDQKRS